MVKDLIFDHSRRLTDDYCHEPSSLICFCSSLILLHKCDQITLAYLSVVYFGYLRSKKVLVNPSPSAFSIHPQHRQHPSFDTDTRITTRRCFVCSDQPVFFALFNTSAAHKSMDTNSTFACSRQIHKVRSDIHEPEWRDQGLPD